jgi:hypothetical protein
MNSFGLDVFGIYCKFFLLKGLPFFTGGFAVFGVSSCLGFAVSFLGMGLGEVLFSLLYRTFISVSLLCVGAFSSCFLYLLDLFIGCLISQNFSLWVACLKYNGHADFNIWFYEMNLRKYDEPSSNWYQHWIFWLNILQFP